MVYRWNKRGIIMLLVAMLVLAGCQPVDGFDPVKVFEQEQELASYEGSLSLKFEYDIDSNKFSQSDELGIGYPAPYREAYELMNGLELRLSELKVNKKSGTASGKGLLTKAELQIPFEYSVEGDSVVIQVKGARNPLTLKLGVLTDELSYSGNDWLRFGRASSPLSDTSRERVHELSKKALQLMVRNLPSTDSLSLQRNQVVDIHGSQATGTTMAFDVTGTQMPELIKKYLRSLTLDDKGLREMADSLFEYLKEEKSVGGRYQEWFTDKEVSVEGIYGVEKFLLATLSSIVTTKQQEIHFSPDTKVHLDLFVDSQQLVRKTNLNIQFKDEIGGLKGGKVQFQMERWNMNGSVQPVLLTSKEAIDIARLDTPEAIMEQVEEGSNLYTFLKRDLKMTRKQFTLWLMTKTEFDDMVKATDDYDYGYDYVPDGFTSDNVAYGQVREISERLGYKAEWDSASHSVLVQTGKKEIRFTPNSSMALVNGQQVDMGHEAQFIHGVYFVPVRFLVEQLDGQISWNPDSPYMLTVTKN